MGILFTDTLINVSACRRVVDSEIPGNVKAVNFHAGDTL